MIDNEEKYAMVGVKPLLIVGVKLLLNVSCFCSNNTSARPRLLSYFLLQQLAYCKVLQITTGTHTHTHLTSDSVNTHTM